MINGKVLWFTNCVDYLKSAIDKINNSYIVDKMVLKNYGDGHRKHSSTFRPELYVTEKLGEEMTYRYQKLIGVLRWSIELRRIDVLT